MGLGRTSCSVIGCYSWEHDIDTTDEGLDFFAVSEEASKGR